jgi:hypothetical protein
MKRIKFLLPALFIGAGVLFLTGCGDDDLSVPVITLEGDDPQIIDLGGTYTESGAIATDDTDGDISDNVVIDATGVNTAIVGKYTVTYTVTDEAGNTGVSERNVWVRATADDYVGFFTVVENCAGSIPSYEIQMEKINETSLRLTNLGDFSAGETIFDMELSGDLNEIVSINDTDDTDPDLTCTASGELVQGVAGSMNLNVSYTFDDGADSFTCSDVDIEQN